MQSSSSSTSTELNDFDVIVIGAGVVGAAIGRELAVGGSKVLIVDEGARIGAGCSYANAALLAPGHVGPLATPTMMREVPIQLVRRPPAVRFSPDPRMVPWLLQLAGSGTATKAKDSGAALQALAAESMTLYQELARTGVVSGLRKTGAIDVWLKSPKNVGSALSLERLREHVPTLGDNVAVGTHEAEEWVLESRGFVAAMLDDAVRAGADLRWGSRVQGLLRSGDAVRGARIDGEDLTARDVVLAAGLGTKALAATAGLRVPLRGGRGYVVDVERSETPPPMPVRVKENRVVITPLEDRTRIAGFMEFGSETRKAGEERAKSLVTVAARALPELADARVIEWWAGERPCTPDGLPIIGGSAEVPHLSVAAGHGMWGMILAPVTAKLIADGLESGAPNTGAMSPDRFTRTR